MVRAPPAPPAALSASYSAAPAQSAWGPSSGGKTNKPAESSVCDICEEFGPIGAFVGGPGCTCASFMAKAAEAQDMKVEEALKAKGEQEFDFDYYSED